MDKRTVKKYDSSGVRLTGCCGAYSTYAHDGVLACKHCWHEVNPGEGDGNETKTRIFPSVRIRCKITPRK